MFTLEIDDSLQSFGKQFIRITLRYKSESTQFSFCPSPFTDIKDSSSGNLNQGDLISDIMHNSNIGLSWDNNIFKLYSCFNDSDLGGTLTQTLILNDEEVESFHYCLSKWQAYQEHNNAE